MSNTYVACSMSSLSHEEYATLREIIIAVCNAIDAAGGHAYSDPFDTTTGFHSPAEALARNVEALEAATAFVYIHTSKEATSALIELGYVLKRRTPITVFAKEGIVLPYYLRDAATAETYGISIVPFKNEEDLPLIVWQAFQ